MQETHTAVQVVREPVKLLADQPVLVGEICNKQPTPLIRRSNTLTEAANALISSARTAAAVVDQPAAGATAGITENDILQAYLINVPWTYSVEQWLHTDVARIPSFVVDHLTVRPCMPITDAAAVMQAQANGFYSCRHLIVKDDGDQHPGAILSALDLAKALCSLPATSTLAQHFRAKTVGELMKPRSSLPVIPKTATLVQAVHEMLGAAQNCVFISETDAEGLWPGLEEEQPLGNMLGIVTPRDVLLAFVEHIPGESRVDSWLQGLHSRMQPRTIHPKTTVADAAAVMRAVGVHHLVVVTDGPKEEVLGVLSATDLAYELGSEQQVAMAVAGA